MHLDEFISDQSPLESPPGLRRDKFVGRLLNFRRRAAASSESRLSWEITSLRNQGIRHFDSDLSPPLDANTLLEREVKVRMKCERLHPRKIDKIPF